MPPSSRREPGRRTWSEYRACKPSSLALQSDRGPYTGGDRNPLVREGDIVNKCFAALGSGDRNTARTVAPSWNMFSDTPLPPEEPTGQNPPEGTVLDYYLPAPTSEVTLEIRDAQGAVVRRYSSRDEPERIDPSTLPYALVRPKSMTSPPRCRRQWRRPHRPRAGHRAPRRTRPAVPLRLP